MQPAQIENLDASDSSATAVEVDVVELEDQELSSVAGGPHVVNN